MTTHRSAMWRRFGLPARWFARRAFRHVRLDLDDIARLRRLAQQGTVVYVMRYCSLVDYFLVNYVLLREELPLPRFANGVSTIWFRPLRDIMAVLWSSLRSAQLFGKELRRFRERELVSQLTTHGRSVLLFIRSRRRDIGARASREGRARLEGRAGRDYLHEIVRGLWGKDQPVFLVPIAIFRGSGLRRQGSRIASLIYSVHEAPSDVKKLATYFWNGRELRISVGSEIDLNGFMARYRAEGEARIVRRLTRALQIFLYREERVVWGPTLRAKRRVREIVLSASEVEEQVRGLAAERKVSEARVAKEARGYFDEMAADFHGYYFTILAFFFNRVWRRMFSGLDVRGLDRVVERLKQHPIVLVPCHRSHFDYLILSYIFQQNHLSPPHIAAGINMAFWPMGPFFRGAGAYFIRRTFEGNPLYKTVFGAYLTYLIREGYTQEFFIEGGRSRTGKILTPKLGMLTAIVNAFRSGVRRDLYLVPVSIHYGRIAEEGAYSSELLGERKEKESLSALIKARRVLRQRYGTVYVTFAEPISLNDALGPLQERVRTTDADAVVEARRHFAQKLGFRLLREVNAVAVAGATSVSSTVLLASPNAAIRYDDFVVAARALTDVLISKGVTLTASLQRNLETFVESLQFLQTGRLVEWVRDRDSDIIHVTPEKRLALDFYKNNIIHFFLIPSLVAHALRRGVARADLEEEVWWWLDLFRWEFALPERAGVVAEIEETLAYFESQRAVVGGELHPDHVLLVFEDGILESFREAYWIAAKALLDVDADGLTRKGLLARMRKSFELHRLLGEIRKPEGSSEVTFENAISRFAELAYVVQSKRGRREQIVMPGDDQSGLSDLERRLASSLEAHLVLSRAPRYGAEPGAVVGR